MNREEFMRTLNTLDFGPLVYKLMHAEDRPGISLEQALDAVKKYKGFLLLYYLSPGKMLSPSRYIDYVWHTHILDTELYATQTRALFGYYLHHFPFFGARGEADQKELLAAATLTRELAAKYLGWDDDDWCGTKPHPKWPGSPRKGLADLAAVLFPAGGLGEQLRDSGETLTIETGRFRQTIEHLGTPDADLLNVGAPPIGYAPSMGSAIRKVDTMAVAIGLMKLPKWVTVCMPRVDLAEAFKSATRTELLADEKRLIGQRLSPEGFAANHVQLEVTG